MKILITGGSGFIGSHIADGYAAAGHQVVIVDRRSDRHHDKDSPNIRFYREDIVNEVFLDILKKEKPDVVNHHAAQISVVQSMQDPVGYTRTNVLGTLQLLEGCRREGVQKVIFASSGGAIYGELLGTPAGENDFSRPQNPYGITKLAIEYYLRFYADQHGIPFVALRYANVYGPRQDSSGEGGVVAIFTRLLLQGEPPVIYGDGGQTRDFVFVEDVVDCNVKALSPEVVGIHNVSTGVETDVNSLVRMLGQIVDRPISPVYADARRGEIKRSCLKPGVLQSGAPTSLAVGLEKTVEWFKSNPSS